MRIRICKHAIALFALCSLGSVTASEHQTAASVQVEQWGIYEISLAGPAGGNPFRDVSLKASFTQGDQTLEVAGFYDGDGIYRIRFMPDKTGQWRYRTKSDREELDGKEGTFTCNAASPNNHGPVRVHNTYHFAYADGAPYIPVGTTCYAWVHQGDELEEQTLASLKRSPFNKLRMCIFPKHYVYNENEPLLFPFEKDAQGEFDFSRFNPQFFRHLEKRVGQLRDLGIEADLILFHPYDRWGFAVMGPENDDHYLRYVIARLAAYRNVWWSLANEFDFMMKENRPEIVELKKKGKQITLKTMADWDRFFQILQNEDPHRHLRSIHNGAILYNHTKPWVTHASIQNGSAVTDYGRAELLRDVYQKPIVYDEVKYEGNIPRRWGNISAEEMVYRFWQGTIAGTYVGHGETYLHPRDIIWWSKGGVLHGRSPDRIAFLRKILEEGPAEGLEPIDKWQDQPVAGKIGEYYLYYFGKERLRSWSFQLPRAGYDFPAMTKFKVEVLDTWNMTITPVEGTFAIKPQDNYFYTSDHLPVRLPGKPYLALRIRRVH
ncbi:MAG: DUF5060 domain-containing protein [Blastocatellia bacterium]|nr:DUF5060 domain-containing protein [Blastocatellia bacterium]